MKYDVCIIGGGVAGLSTALQICSQTDANVVIIDKRRIGDPAKSSPFTFPETADRYGLNDAVLQTYTSFTFRSPRGPSATFEYKEPAYVTLDYEKSCHLLLDQVRKSGNVQVIENTEVMDIETSLIPRTQESTLRLSENESIKSNIIVDASGASFLTARSLGISLPSFYSHAYGEILCDCEVENSKEMHILSGARYGNGGGWFYPIDKSKARYGFATVTRSISYPSDVVRRNFLDAFENFYPYNKMLRGARKIRSEFGTIPIGALGKFVFNNILIVGDAAGQATPWYCEGIRPALESGEICGRAIVKAYKQKSDYCKTLNRYQAEWDALHRSTYTEASRNSANQWFRTQEDWDMGIKKASSLSPEAMKNMIKHGRAETGFSTSIPFNLHRFLRARA